MLDTPVTDRKVSYVATGGETRLYFDWRVDAPSDLVVARTRNQVDETLVEIVDYNISGIGDPRGGYIDLTAAAIELDKYTLQSEQTIGSETIAGEDVVYVLARWRGSWLTSVTYNRGDAVETNGSSYVAISAHVSDAMTRPGTGANWLSYWNLVANGGVDGVDGVDGDPGAKGPPGPAVSLNPANGGLVGINATADTTNRLSLNSPASLFNHAGNGHQLKINKNTVGDTASLLFQTGFSGRAEFGTTGDDDFHVKVSPDGSTFHEAFVVDKDTGAVQFPNTSAREFLTTARTYYVRTDGNDANDGRGDSPSQAFATIQRAIDIVFGTLDVGGNDVTIQVANGTYSEALQVYSPQVGAGRIILSGDTNTPSNVTISSGGVAIYVKGKGTRLFVRGIKVTSAGLAGWYADAGGVIESDGKNEVGAVNGGHHIVSDATSVIRIVHEMVISGGCPGAHLTASNLGFLYTQSASWTISGSPTVGFFANAGTGGVIYTFSNAFSGVINGQRYIASLNGVIQTNTGNQNYWPGTTAGSATSGGQYS